jgi:hypothetical protein
MDESLHAVGAYAHTFAGEYHINPEHPPLWKYWAMLPHRAADLNYYRSDQDWDACLASQYERQLWFAGNTLYRGGGDGVAFINRSRMAMLALSLALGALVMTFAWKAAGPVAAVIAGALFCFDPNFLGHGPLVTNDTATALAIVRVGLRGVSAGKEDHGCAGNVGGAALRAGTGREVHRHSISATAWIVVADQSFECAALERPQVARFAAAGCAGIASPGDGADLRLHMGRVSLPLRGGRSDGLRMDFGPHVTNAVRNAYFVKHHEWPSPGQEQTLPRPAMVRMILWANEKRLLPDVLAVRVSVRIPGQPGPSQLSTGRGASNGLVVLLSPGHGVQDAGGDAGGDWAEHRRRGNLVCRRRSQLVFDDAWLALCILIPLAVYCASAMSANLNLGIRHILPVYPFLFLAVAIVLARLAAWRRRVMDAWRAGARSGAAGRKHRRLSELHFVLQ